MRTMKKAKPAGQRSRKGARGAAEIDGNPIAVTLETAADVVRTGSVDLVVSEILRGVHEGRYVPGQKLIEADLTRKIGVGRGTVREAIRKLEANGLVAASLHRGARIRSFSREGARDVIEVYEHLITLAARLAAERLPRTKDADALRDALAEMTEQLKRGDTYEMSQLRYQFLASVIALANNSELRKLLPGFHAVILRAQFRSIFDLEFATKDIEHFKDIVKAILARDGARAEDAMRRYVRRFGIAIQRSPDGYFAD